MILMYVFKYICLGIFVAKGDVGVGTIVGSAVFNVACVIGICGLFVNEVSFQLKKRF
jgi:Ca2+/Na+ antiporter